jgi:segregation and condensation protein B
MDHQDDNDDVVTFIPGSSVIDIAEIRRAQAKLDAELDDEPETESSEETIHTASESEEKELSLDEQAKLIMHELSTDAELQKDVLADFEETASNEDLEKIAEGVATQTAEDIARYAKLSMEVSDELRAENIDMIKEDILLESTIAQEMAADLGEKVVEVAGKKKKGKKGKAAASSEVADESTVTTAADSTEESMATPVLELSDDDESASAEELSEQDLALKAALPQIDENGEYNMEDLQSCISALLFYSEKSLSLKKMKEMLEMPEAEDELFLNAIAALKEEFAKSAHGFEIAEIAGGYQYRTKIARAPLLRKLAKVQIQRLSRGAMEALTIVAFKQPCTKDDIDQVRGVDSSHFIRTLLDRHLIEVTGRSEAAGRPMIYGTTDTFLEVFGMMDLKGLPSLSEIEAMVPQLAAQEEGKEDPHILRMRSMVNQMKTESNHLGYSAKEDDIILQEIRDKVKSIDVTTPYLARQKELAEQGIQGIEAEDILNREFGFVRDANAEVQAAAETSPETQTELKLEGDLTVVNESSLVSQDILDAFLSEDSNPHVELSADHELSVEESTEMNHVREALKDIDLDKMIDE